MYYIKLMEKRKALFVRTCKFISENLADSTKFGVELYTKLRFRKLIFINIG